MRGSKIHPLCSSLPPTEATGTRDDDHGMQRVQQSSGKRRWRVLKSFDEQLCSPHFNRARCCGQVCGFRSVSDAVWRRMSTSLALHRARLAASWCGASQLCSRFMRTNVKSSLLPEGGLLAVSAYITTLVQVQLCPACMRAFFVLSCIMKPYVNIETNISLYVPWRAVELCAPKNS